jgi:multidrug transporter EmrE-like cation transporter
MQSGTCSPNRVSTKSCFSGLFNIQTEGRLFLGVTVTLHGLYVILLSRTYSVGDLSQVYPLMRGMSPLLVPIFGVSILGEKMPGAGWFGVVCVVVGIWVLGNWRFGRYSVAQRLAPRATWLGTGGRVIHHGVHNVGQNYLELHTSRNT